VAEEAEVVRSQTALLDVLITEHRDRKKALEDRNAAVQTTIGAMASGLVALFALLAPRLPFDQLHGTDKQTFGIGCLAAAGVIVTWIDAIAGPLRSSFKSYQRAVAAAAERFEEAQPSLDPVAVRAAIIERLIAEENLVRNQLKPRETSLRLATFGAGVAVFAVLKVVLHLSHLVL
jgi:hypothetical protein